ncbi:MAG: hypothetical protein GXY52_08745 [Chloroflexi bacterium]|nr:hypothetical protein [Chloroflexota bacterium]
MAKNRRSTSRRRSAQATRQAAPPPAAATSAPAKRAPLAQPSSTTPDSTARAAAVPEAETQYKYVAGDLKQLGFTALAMFGVMVILALVIR